MENGIEPRQGTFVKPKPLTPAERKALADLAPRPKYILPIEALAIGGPRRLNKELAPWLESSSTLSEDVLEGNDRGQGAT